MKKIVKRVVIGLVGLVVIAIGIIWLSLNSIVRSTVESQTATQLGVPATLGGANVSLFGQSLSLNDLKIGSPKGFPAPQLFTLGGTNVSVSVTQLTGTPVRVESIAVNQPTLVIEQQNLKLNFKALIDGMPSPPTQADKTAEQKEPIKLIINHLKVNGANIIIRPGEFPGVKLPSEISMKIPDLALDNIGNADGNQNGAAIKEVVVQLITVLAAKAAESDQLPAELRSVLAMDVNAITAQLHQQFAKQLDKVMSEATKNLPKEIGGVDTSRLKEEPGKAVEQGLKGLLDGKKDRKKKD